MNEIGYQKNHQALVDRFVGACQADKRIVAAFLVGSYASGAADEYSDLDLFIVITDEDFDDFYSNRTAFMHLLGDPVFLEDFGNPNIVFYTFADGSEGELGLYSESQLESMLTGPFIVLLERKKNLADTVYRGNVSDPLEQTEKLRRLIYWFWHELSHFITAMGRGQLWWAQGQLESMRGYCVNLARLRNNFSDTDAGDEPYFKIEMVMPVEQLAPLKVTFGPMDKDKLLQSVQEIVKFYQELAIPLAQDYGIRYPDVLEGVMLNRLENIR